MFTVKNVFIDLAMRNHNPESLAFVICEALNYINISVKIRHKVGYRAGVVLSL